MGLVSGIRKETLPLRSATIKNHSGHTVTVLHRRSADNLKGPDPVLDLAFIGLTAGLFVILLLVTKGIERL